MLLHGGEAHLIAARERRYGLLALDRVREDVAPRRVGERVEHAISLLLGQLIYNHSVVG